MNNIETTPTAGVIMAFRDHLGAATEESAEVSLIHGMLKHSQASGHAMTVYTNIPECPGHRAAVNMLTRDQQECNQEVRSRADLRLLRAAQQSVAIEGAVSAC